MNEQITKLYNQRVADFKAAADLKKPSVVPINIELLYWALAYAGVKTRDVLGKPQEACAAYTKVFDDVYTDGIHGSNIAVPLRVIEALGGSNYFISEDGYAIQHLSQSYMEADEYEQLIADPKHFFVNILAKRKFKNLNGTDQENYTALKNAVIELQKYVMSDTLICNYLKEEKGILKTSARGAYDFRFLGIF